jgi:hypothetical protein
MFAAGNEGSSRSSDDGFSPLSSREVDIGGFVSRLERPQTRAAKSKSSKLAPGVKAAGEVSTVSFWRVLALGVCGGGMLEDKEAP